MKTVTDLEVDWSAYREPLKAIPNLKVWTPDKWGWEKIRQLQQSVGEGDLSKKAQHRREDMLRDIIRHQVPSSCTHVVLAMTEFTPVLATMSNTQKQGKIFIDPMEIYADYIARLWLGQRP